MLRFSFKKNDELLTKMLFPFLLVLLCGFYAGSLANRTMPFAEGWYTYYSQCINDGALAYRDFDYLFTPCYLYMIAIITKLFGYKIIVLRCFGVLVFCLIACIYYAILRELFSPVAAFVAAAASVFYMQSEIVQIFYDYVRILDIFIAFAIFFLVKIVKERCLYPEKKSRNQVLFPACAGFFNALALLVKQNVGVVFFAFSIILLVAAFLVMKEKRALSRTFICFVTAFLIPILITVAILSVCGGLLPFLQQSSSAAIAAKGGVFSILFGWFGLNNIAFADAVRPACLFLAVIAITKLLCVKLSVAPYESSKTKTILFLGVSFFAVCILCLRLFYAKKTWTLLFESHPYTSPYVFFLVICPIFIYLVLHCVTRAGSLSKELLCRDLLLITLSGSFIAIAWSCGMSGGLVEGQTTIGVAFLVALLLDNLHFKHSSTFYVAAILLMAVFVLHSGAKKYVHTYNWWGMEDSDIWDSTLTSPDIDLLKGIRMSEETLNAYETVYHEITENTTPEDSIYCFPQIPVFYSLCERKDPGGRAKVQWFDVASDQSIENDIKVIESNPPAAVIIFETSEYAYNAHEKAFRGGSISATRRMKQFLLNFVQDNNYTFQGRIFGVGNNSLLLYLKTEESIVNKGFIGHGTMEDPYLVSSPYDLQILSSRVKDGNDYAGQYFCQTCDLDMSSIPEWTPIGEFDSGGCFRGIYNGNGYEIRNLSCISEGNNVGLFGQLGGIVCNLGVVDCYIEGYCVGIISSHAFDNGAVIMNCYTDSTASGFRAGGIADNFIGSVINCVSLGDTYGLEYANAISYYSGNIINVYSLADANHSGVVRPNGNDCVIMIDDSYIRSETILQQLNRGRIELVDAIDNPESSLSLGDSVRWLRGIPLNRWIVSDGEKLSFEINDA